jgi:hypothetical protein
LVFPGDQERSLLYLKLAAKEGRTDLTERGVSGDPMPFGDMDPLSQDELDAVRAWIRSGAPGTTLVKGTEGLLGCSGPVEFDPNKMGSPTTASSASMVLRPIPTEVNGVRGVAWAVQLTEPLAIRLMPQLAVRVASAVLR